MIDTIRIHRRFQGPPGSGNGGYVAGRLAAYLGGAAIVRLNAPPPLDVDLAVHRNQDMVSLVDDGVQVAHARSHDLKIEVPTAPSLATAREATRRYRGFDEHEFPHCFVCGPAREPGDGLRVFPGPVGPSTDFVACTWTPDPSLADAEDSRHVAPEFVWAALDCPGVFALGKPSGGTFLLGELAVALAASVPVGEPCVLIGWLIARDGRKHVTGTAVFNASGVRLGVGLGTWIHVSSAALARKP